MLNYLIKINLVIVVQTNELREKLWNGRPKLNLSPVGIKEIKPLYLYNWKKDIFQFVWIHQPFKNFLASSTGNYLYLLSISVILLIFGQVGASSTVFHPIFRFL